MPFTADEFSMMSEFVRRHMMQASDRQTQDYLKHLEEQSHKDLEFRHFVKNHYPEALVEWNALQKLGE